MNFGSEPNYGNTKCLGHSLTLTFAPCSCLLLRYEMLELLGRGAEMQAVEAVERNQSVSLHRVKTWPQLMCCVLV